MQSTGLSSDKKSYRVILLLVVGLAAFSSAMKELNQVRELTMQTSSLIAQLSKAIAPARTTETLVQVETCEKILPPAVPSMRLEFPEIVVLDPLPPKRSRIRTVTAKRSVQKETINLRSASNLMQKRDRRTNG